MPPRAGFIAPELAFPWRGRQRGGVSFNFAQKFPTAADGFDVMLEGDGLDGVQMYSAVVSTRSFHVPPVRANPAGRLARFTSYALGTDRVVLARVRRQPAGRLREHGRRTE
jgi:hypothetical protein